MPARCRALAGLSVTILLMSAGAAHAQATLVVDADGHASAASCGDPAPAYASIAAAMAAAAPGDSVQVCPGTYVGLIDFAGKAITVRSTDGAAATIIDGNSSGSVVTFASGEGAGSVIDGFTIRNGRATFATPSFGDGGGIWIRDASPMVRNNIIRDNVSCEGGGLFVRSGSPVIERNTIASNVLSLTICSGGVGGGGIAIVGSSTAQVRGNTITTNTVTSGSSGGGIMLNGAGTPTIERNVISGNRINFSGSGICAGEGGGIALVNQTDAAIVGNLIVGNTAVCGGGIYWLTPFGDRGPLVVNNTIALNDARNGSAVFVEGYDAAAEAVNNIIVAGVGDSAIFCGDFYDYNNPTLRFNDVFSVSGAAYGGICGDLTGTNGNISVDPLFVDAAGGDFHVAPGSAAIDAGDNAATAMPSVDLDGSARVRDGDGDGLARVDMGTYEAAALFVPNGAISGTVADAGTGGGVGGITVEVFTATATFAKSAMTAGDGTYVVIGLPPASYFARTVSPPATGYVDELFDGSVCLMCSVTSGTPILVSAGATTTAVDFSLSTGGAISGTVKSQNFSQSLSGVAVEVYDAAGILVRTTPSVNGAYTVVGLPAGTYYARTRVAENSNLFPLIANLVDQLYSAITCLDCVVTSGTAIVVSAGATHAGVDFVLPPGGIVSGRVYDAVISTGLIGVTVRVYTSTGSLARTAVTDQAGFYSVDRLPSGTYFARTFLSTSLPYADELFDDIPCAGCVVTTGTPIAVTANQMSFAYFALAGASAEVMHGHRMSLTVADSVSAQWAYTQVVAGRSYCVELSPAPSASVPAAPTLNVYDSGQTLSVGASSTRVCFVAPSTGRRWMKVMQANSSPRSYQLRVAETTLFGNWFYTAGNYSSYTMLRNTTDATIHATVVWRGSSGDSVATESLVIPPRGVVYRDARGRASTLTSGSVEIAHDGEPQALIASQTTLSATAGLSFDSVFRQRQ